MEFKRFLKNRAIVFLLVQAGITLSIGIIGCISPTPRGISPYGFFMPFIYAFFCVLISFVTYSPRELSIKQTMVRNVIDFVLVELAVIVISYMAGALVSTFMLVAVTLAAAVVFTAVGLINYYILKKDADAMTRKIRRIKAGILDDKG